MSIISDSKREFNKWSQFIRRVRPKLGFKDCPDPGTPDYSSLDAWLAHPNMVHKASFRPKDITESIVNQAPSFFIHPTTFFGGDNWNADIHDLPSRKMIAEMVLPGQASVLNHLGEVYSPIYRQATFYAFLTSTKDAFAAFDLAYNDVAAAFDTFLEQIGDKPFFITGHSQGSLLGIRLLLEKIDTDERLAKRLVAAYLPGYKFPKYHFDQAFKRIKAGVKPDQVNCVLAWDTFLEGFHLMKHIDNASTWFKQKGKGMYKRRLTYTPFCINPITWDVDIPLSDISEHKGAVVTESDRKGIKWLDASSGENPMINTMGLSAPNDKLISARVGLGNLLYISKPKGRIYNIGKMPGGNYHVYDFNLFYMDIRTNASKRWEVYKALYLD